MSNSTRPTAEQVAAEIATLNALKPRVPARTGFDDNHAAIDAQIAVLTGPMSRESTYYTYGWGDDEAETDEHTLDAALQAQDWLEGATAEAPSLNWSTVAV